MLAVVIKNSRTQPNTLHLSLHRGDQKKVPEEHPANVIADAIARGENSHLYYFHAVVLLFESCRIFGIFVRILAIP